MANGYTSTLAEVNPQNAPLLDVIYQLESSSGKNRTAYTKNSVGALGGYQIRDVTYKDLQKMNPQKWGNLKFEDVMSNNHLARVAAGDYVDWVEKYLVSKGVSPSVENILLGYHSGVGNVVKGKIGKAGIEYVQRAHKIMFPDVYGKE